MKLTDFEDLRQVAISKLGISSFELSEIPSWEKRLQRGLIEITNPQELVLGQEGKDHFLAINPETGDIHKVILYIPQREHRFVEKKGIPEGCHRYHLFQCETSRLKDFINGKHNRYRISSRTDGCFQYTIIDDNNTPTIYEDLELLFCGHCKHIHTKRFRQTNPTFNLKRFLETNFSEFYRNPTSKYDFDDIPNIYATNWDELARKHKKSKNHTCQQCQWTPKHAGEGKYLHAHHIDALKHNNRYDNIKILCIACHSEQSGHGFIKAATEYKQFLRLKGN